MSEKELFKDLSYLGDTFAEVGDMGAHCPDGGQLFLLAEPFLNTNGLFVRHGDVEGQVLEAFGQSSAGSFDCDDARLDGGVHILGNCNTLVGVNHLHAAIKGSNKVWTLFPSR